MQRHHEVALRMLGGLLVLLWVESGCSVVRVHTNAYLGDQPFPSSESASTIFVEASGADQPALLAREVTRATAVELERRGYVCVEDPSQADYVLTCAFGINDARIESRTVPRTYGRRWSTYLYGGHHGVHYSTTYGTGTYYEREYYRQYDRFLMMTLLDRARFDASPEEQRDSAIIWQAQSVSSGASRNVRGVVPFLLAATFEHFGEDTGGLRRHTYHQSSDRPKEFMAGSREHRDSAAQDESGDPQD